MTDYWWLLVVIWLGQINFSLWLIWLFGSDHQLQDAFISWRMLPDLVLFGLLDSCDCFKWLFCWCRRVGRCGLVFNGCPRNAPSSSRQEFRAMASIERWIWVALMPCVQRKSVRKDKHAIPEAQFTMFWVPWLKIAQAVVILSFNKARSYFLANVLQVVPDSG